VLNVSVDLSPVAEHLRQRTPVDLENTTPAPLLRVVASVGRDRAGDHAGTRIDDSLSRLAPPPICATITMGGMPSQTRRTCAGAHRRGFFGGRRPFTDQCNTSDRQRSPNSHCMTKVPMLLGVGAYASMSVAKSKTKRRYAQLGPNPAACSAPGQRQKVVRRFSEGRDRRDRGI
jgi:hypothetical protein